jgi:hypothetical protein
LLLSLTSNKWYRTVVNSMHTLSTGLTLLITFNWLIVKTSKYVWTISKFQPRGLL